MPEAPMAELTYKDRLKLDMDKVQSWLKKGAQPSDRIMRFLDAAGIRKREKRNNPEKAVPRKERKAKAEEAVKAASAAPAAPAAAKACARSQCSISSGSAMFFATVRQS